MLFDNVTLKKGMDFAAQLCAVHRQLSPIDLRDILLGCFSGLPIAGKNQCDHIRKNIVSLGMPMASFMERILARRPSTSSAVVSPTTPMVRAMSA